MKLTRNAYGYIGGILLTLSVSVVLGYRIILNQTSADKPSDDDTGLITFYTSLPTEIQILRQEIDVGKIPVEGVAQATYKIVNTGRRNLTIETIDTGCDCTAVQWEESFVTPGDTTEIIIKYEDTHIVGDFHRVIEVKGNIPGGSLFLRFKGDIV